MHRARGELVRLRGAQVSLCNLSLRGSSSMGISHTPLCSTDEQLHRRRSARAAAWGAPRLPHIPRLPYKPRRSYTSNLKPCSEPLRRAFSPSAVHLGRLGCLSARGSHQHGLRLRARGHGTPRKGCGRAGGHCARREAGHAGLYPERVARLPRRRDLSGVARTAAPEGDTASLALTRWDDSRGPSTCRTAPAAAQRPAPPAPCAPRG